MWEETADLTNVSASGAGFCLPHECGVGSLVSLTMPLHPHLRSYDLDKDLYCVWGLVQHCHKLTSDGPIRYHIGVAFIGKNPPASYNEDPLQTYRVCGMSGDGLWKVKESKTPFKTRRYPRFRVSIDHYLALLDGRQQTIGGERTVTENISKSGAAVFTTLNVAVGDRVKFICERYDFSGLAVVCDRLEAGQDERARLHLHFVDSQFPIESINLSEASAENA